MPPPPEDKAKGKKKKKKPKKPKSDPAPADAVPDLPAAPVVDEATLRWEGVLSDPELEAHRIARYKEERRTRCGV